MFKDKPTMWIGQPLLLGKLEERFGNMDKSKAHTQTPGTPVFEIIWTKRVIPSSTTKTKIYTNPDLACYSIWLIIHAQILPTQQES